VAADLPITIVLDVDGTLVDTNYQHAIAWHRALRDHGYAVQVWEIHRHIGMGGDQLIEALIGEEGEKADGEAIREAVGRSCPRRLEEGWRRRAGGDGRRLDLGREGRRGGGLATLAVVTGGFSEAELREAGASEVVKSVAVLLNRGALARLAGAV
jgi:hypothetical protein